MKEMNGLEILKLRIHVIKKCFMINKKSNGKVREGRQFLSWIIGLGEGVTIVGPESVVRMMNAEIDRLIKQYKR